MSTTSTSSPRKTAGAADKADKRAAILGAALRLIAGSGLHGTPVLAIAREAGVGAGTVYRYFPSKEAMINALYLELMEEQTRVAQAGVDRDAGVRPSGADDVRETMWRGWSGLARWHLDRPQASKVLHQCRVSGILTAETREKEQRGHAAGLEHFRQAIAQRHLRDLAVPVFWALFYGPITALTESRAAGEIEVTEEVLRVTFDGVCRGVLSASPE